jgi:hypothetical protein
MPDKTQVCVPDFGYGETIRYMAVKSNLLYGDSETIIRAAQTLASMKKRASDAIADLELVLFSYTISVEVAQNIIIALDQISPMYEKLMKPTLTARLAVLAAADQVSNSKPKVSRSDMVTSNIIQEDGDIMDTDLSRKCFFCEKEQVCDEAELLFMDQIKTKDKFYCTECLRHYRHNNYSDRILMLSFRAIFGYWYYEEYRYPKIPTMYLSEIAEQIHWHKEIGLKNPLFSYDDESSIWFVNFGGVGASKKVTAVDCSKKTICSILDIFSGIANIDLPKLEEKYNLAIDQYCEKFVRPEGGKLLCPTLKDCGHVKWQGSSYNAYYAVNGKVPIEKTREFLPELISPDKHWRRHS